MQRTIALFFMLALAACSQAAPPPDDIAAASAKAVGAAKQLTVLAKGSQTTGKAPRLTDSSAAPLLSAVLDTRSLATATPSFADYGPVSGWITATNRLSGVYLLAGTGVDDLSKVGAANQQQVGRNAMLYAPELGGIYDALLTIGAAKARLFQKASADKELMADPAVQDDMKHFKSGAAGTVDNVLDMIADSDHSAEWKRARGKALVATAPSFGQLLGPEAQPLRAKAEQDAQAINDPVLKSELTQFADLMGAPPAAQ